MKTIRFALSCITLLLALGAKTDVSAQTSTSELISAARAAAARDDHPSAITAYREAIAGQPSLRDSLGHALASQLTWAGRYDEAIEEFEWLLARDPHRADARRALALAQSWSGRTEAALASYRTILQQQPTEVEARLGEARMLAWLGRTTDAVHHYEAILRDHPNRPDASLGLAMVHNWRGDHERAARLFGPFATAEPPRVDAMEGLAWARQWGGRSDAAIASLDDLAARELETQASRELRSVIENDWSPRANGAVDWSRDSDEFEARGYRVGVDWPVRYRARLHAAILRNEFRKDGSDDVNDAWFLAGVVSRVLPQLQASAAIEVAVDPPKGQEDGDLAGDVGLACFMHDRLRLDLGLARQALFTYEAFPDRVKLDLATLGVAWRPQHQTTLLVNVDHGKYLDVPHAPPPFPERQSGGPDIDRTNIRARVRYAAFPRRPKLAVELGTQVLDCSLDQDDGLWTPDYFRSYFARAEAEIQPDRPVTGLLWLEGGWGKEYPRPYDPFIAYGAGLIARPGPLRIDLRAGYSDSNAEIERGYRRKFASVGATWKF